MIEDKHVEVAKEYGIKCTVKGNDGKREWSAKALLQGTAHQKQVSTHVEHAQYDSIYHRNPSCIEMSFGEKGATLGPGS